MGDDRLEKGLHAGVGGRDATNGLNGAGPSLIGRRNETESQRVEQEELRGNASVDVHFWRCV